MTPMTRASAGIFATVSYFWQQCNCETSEIISFLTQLACVEALATN